MKISVIITTYNKYRYILQVLLNLEKQTRNDLFEVILIIDGSTDKTVDFVKNLDLCYSFKYCVTSNSGLATARNKGIELASSPYLLFLDDDLILIPEYIENLHKKILSYPDRIHVGNLFKVKYSYVNELLWNENGYRDILIGDLKNNLYYDPVYEPLKILFKNRDYEFQPACWWAIITGGNLCVPYEVLLNIGYFDENFKSWGPEDIDLCYRAFKLGIKISYNPENELFHLDHYRNPQKLFYSMAKNALLMYKKYNKPKEMLAYLNFFNGTISLGRFNEICSDIFKMPGLMVEDFYLNLNGYINKQHIINWKSTDEFNEKI